MNVENRVFTIGEKGSSRLWFGNKWTAQEAPKRGLRDPWAHRPDGLLRVEEVMTKLGAADKEIKSYQSIHKECTEEELAAWKTERDEYMRQRDEWIALQMFHKYGYETFLEECSIYTKISKDFWKSVFPCESHSNPQCNMFCPIFNDCALRDAEVAQEGGVAK